MKTEDIIKAYVKIRTIDQTIPDDVLDFMKKAAIEVLSRGVSKPDQTLLDRIKDEVVKKYGLEDFSEYIEHSSGRDNAIIEELMTSYASALLKEKEEKWDADLNKAFEDGFKRGKFIQEQEFINLVTYFTDNTPQKAKMIVREWEASGRQSTYDK